MPATAEPPQQKAKRKAPAPPMVAKKRTSAEKSHLSRAAPIVPEQLPASAPVRFYSPEEILSGSPFCMAELATYFDGLTNGQLRRGWKATIATVLTEEHERIGILGKREYKGLIRSTILALEVIHTRFIRRDDPSQTPID